jgi:Tfp pilus assembly protein FimT
VAPASARGAAFLDVLPALALAALVSATTFPVVAGTLERERAWLGANFVAARLVEAQLEALRRGVYVALRVSLESTDAAMQLYADGNGNGVLTTDIASGVDVAIGPADSIGAHAQGVSLRINQRVPDPGGTGWLDTGSDPLRIGSTSLISCSPTGSLTSGTVYVAAERGQQLAVRITGSTGRVRVLRYEPAAGQWHP